MYGRQLRKDLLIRESGICPSPLVMEFMSLVKTQTKGRDMKECGKMDLNMVRGTSSIETEAISTSGTSEMDELMGKADTSGKVGQFTKVSSKKGLSMGSGHGRRGNTSVLTTTLESISRIRGTGTEASSGE